MDKKRKKVYKLNKTITFHKSNPFKTVKIGNSKNYAASMNGFHGDFRVSNAYPIEGKQLSGKVKIEMNKGWTLNSIVLRKVKYDEKRNKEIILSSKKIKNRNKVTLQELTEDNNEYLTITYTNQKTKEKAVWNMYWLGEEMD